MPKNPLLSDLDQIESTLADDPEKTLRELFEWNRGFVRQYEVSSTRILELEAHVQELDDVIEDLVQGVSEGVSVETAKVLVSAYQQARIAIGTFQALLASEKNPLDELSTKRSMDLTNAALLEVAGAMQLISEIVIDDEEGNDDGDSDDGNDGDGSDGDGSGDGSGDGDVGSDSSSEEDDAEEASEDVVEGDAHGA